MGPLIHNDTPAIHPYFVLISTILAYILFREDLTLTKAIGGLIILAAIYMVAKSEVVPENRN